ncbi:lipopolysaccharide assembly protein LapB [Cyanothece sp. BG0011]|uniref:tetratricopeptide repeat protein n=1 Tax=Cyanothece sp. BG0011 TaxID=2082950 RepID=UPI000D1F53C6|nr:tetratricopeptide repeat protein [Cyanothece sp. BG0011]
MFFVYKSLNKIIVLIGLTFLIFVGELVETNPRALSLPEPELNPLEIPLDDPLIPSVPRPLTPLEQKRLRRELDQLNQQAQQELEAGNENTAFEIWYRELRLRRVLGRIEEINALGRVGEIAWNKTRTQDVQIISKRLVELQNLSEQEDPLSPALLIALANAYEKLHSLDNSIIIYKKVLNYARENDSPFTIKEALQGLGRLYLAKFDYPNAAAVYEELLDIAQAEQNTYEEGLYLQALAEIYTASLQPNNAAAIKQRLVDSYLASENIELVPPLKIDIGQDYEALDQPELASQNYQEAYGLAWSLQLFGAAAEALTKLADLYTDYEQENYALQIYQRLIQVEQLSYNYYGLMKVYDKIGEIYLDKEQYQPALSAFQEGLILARSLNHNQDHFLTQIQKVNQGMQQQAPPEVEEALPPSPNNIPPNNINIDRIEEEIEMRGNPSNDIDEFENRFERDNILR